VSLESSVRPPSVVAFDFHGEARQDAVGLLAFALGSKANSGCSTLHWNEDCQFS
jgi:hypothetical protein